MVNNSWDVINIRADDITIIAGSEQIFAGDYAFVLKNRNGSTPPIWKMERAYPQWFGAEDCSKTVSEALNDIKAGNLASGISRLKGIIDSSDAINAAIKLKRRGEVFIPRGFYKISRHISVPPGIQLRGEGTTDQRPSDYGTVIFPCATQGQVMTNSQYYRNPSNAATRACTLPDFPLHPDDVDWLNQGYAVERQYGYMVAVGLKESCTLHYKKISEETDPVTGEVISVQYSNYPQSIEYEGDSGHTSVGAEISSIAFFDLMSIAQNNNVTNDYATLRAILTGGAVTIRDVRVYGLSQLVSSGTFSDQMRIEHCSFNGPVKLRSAGNANLRATLYPTKIYGFDVTKGGDAFVMHGCHAAVYNDHIGALKLRSCNGGSMTGNILNSDVLIELCRGIDFAGNHMEYGSRLTIASSAVAVRGNFIWRGEKAAITIRRYDKGGFLHYHCSVTLDNNQLFWRSQHYDVNHPDVDPPQAAHFLFPYDVVTDGYASISVNNTFRNCNRGANGEESYFGILMGWLKMKGLQSDPNCLDEEQAYTYEGDDPRNVVGTDYARISAFEEFNRVSHIASIGSKVVGRNVSTMPTTLVTSEFRTDRNGTTGITPTFTVEKRAQSRAADGWKAVGVRFEYRMWVLADFERRIVLSGPIEKSETYCPAANENLWIRLGHGTITDFSIPAGPYLLYVERTAYDANNESIGLASVTLPVCAASMLWDDGEYLSGFAWTEISQSLASQWASNYNAKVEQVTFNGRNVECLLDEMPNLTPGSNPIPLFNSTEWIPGDVLRAGDGTSPAPHWVMTSHGWRKM